MLKTHSFFAPGSAFVGLRSSFELGDRIWFQVNSVLSGGREAPCAPSKIVAQMPPLVAKSLFPDQFTEASAYPRKICIQLVVVDLPYRKMVDKENPQAEKP
jgi:hypothetical protein